MGDESIIFMWDWTLIDWTVLTCLWFFYCMIVVLIGRFLGGTNEDRK